MKHAGAKLAQSKLKINTTEFEKSLAERQIINATYNALTNTLTVLAQQTRMVQNYERLLQAELLNLDSGESILIVKSHPLAILLLTLKPTE